MLFKAEKGFHHLPMAILSCSPDPPPHLAPLGLINFFFFAWSSFLPCALTSSLYLSQILAFPISKHL